ncbi:MAG: 3-deoxy-D-manno-octulosonic acid transferase [Pseudomonadota bacterium]
MSNLTSRLVLNLYGLAGYGFQPFSGVLLRARARRGKEDRTRLRERYGEASAKPNGRRVIWVHAASLGETNAVLPLVRRIVDMNFEVVFTTATVTAARKAEIELPKGAVHQFAPLDLKPYVSRFLKHWRPSLAVFVESELWPAMMTELASRNVPQIIVNGRMSERSFKRWRRFQTITRALFDNLAMCVAQSKADADRYSELGAHSVVHAGNMKFDCEPPGVDLTHLAKLQSVIGRRPVWLAASTHEREEVIVASAHKTLKKTFPDLLTIVVPRHPDRGDEIAGSLGELGLNAVQRSHNSLPEARTDIYIGDTIGELGLFYRIAPCSLVGGSLVPHGGQNPIEPARLGSAIVFGPNVANFQAIFRALAEHGGGYCVRNSQELVERVRDILSNEDQKRAMTQGAERVLNEFGGAMERTHQVLLPYLNPLIVAGTLADVDAFRGRSQ